MNKLLIISVFLSLTVHISVIYLYDEVISKIIISNKFSEDILVDSFQYNKSSITFLESLSQNKVKGETISEKMIDKKAILDLNENNDKSKRVTEQKINNKKEDSIISNNNPKGTENNNIEYIAASVDYMPKPIYPIQARRRGLEGVAEFEVLINSIGNVVSVELIKSTGYDILDKAALEAIPKGRFSSAKRKGISENSSLTIKINFKLEDL